MEKRDPDLTVILNEGNDGQYIGVMKFGMAIAQPTT
jgi:hypothetical protein